MTHRIVPGKLPRARIVCALVVASLAGAACADATLYASEARDPVFTYLELEPVGGDAVRGRLLGDPGAHGAAALAFEGVADWEGATMTVRADIEPGSLTITADVAAGGESRLDPFGGARVEGLAGLDGDLAFRAVGTTFSSRASLADGSFTFERQGPLFYADPWRGLDLAASLAMSTGGEMRQGLEQRQEFPQSVAGFWMDVRRVRVTALTPTLVSLLIEHHTYTGGAHPNTMLSARTYLGDGASWRRAAACESVRALAWPCDEAVLRAEVIAGLEAQNAAWVESGEVTAETPWLLDTFTVEPGGVTVHFSPYAVGPYAQGPFTVSVGFPALAP